MGKKAKKEGVNINAESVKSVIERLCAKQAITLVSTSPQVKDLQGMTAKMSAKQIDELDLLANDFRYTMWGISPEGKKCLVILSKYQENISFETGYDKVYPQMRSVNDRITSRVNSELASKEICDLAEASGINVISKFAQPIFIREDEKKVEENGKEMTKKVPVYGYAMASKQNEQGGFAVLEVGSSNIHFISEKPKFL